MTSLRPQGVDRLRGLRQRFQAGEAVTLDEVFRAAGLDGRERFVIRARLAGATFSDIGRGLDMTRARAQQVEAAVMKRLGLRGSIAAVVHEQERAGNALELRECAGGVRGADLHSGPGNHGGWVKLTPREQELEAAADAILAGKRSRRAG